MKRALKHLAYVLILPALVVFAVVAWSVICLGQWFCVRGVQGEG